MTARAAVRIHLAAATLVGMAVAVAVLAALAEEENSV
jgi:hypothetical protein